MDKDQNPFMSLWAWVRPLVPQIKDRAILVAWIGTLILLGALFWYTSLPLRQRYLAASVNRLLEESGDPRRLGAPLEPQGSLFMGLGSWYALEDPAAPGGRAYVFSLTGEGVFFPAISILDSQGNLGELIPLGAYGERLMERIPRGILALYRGRIEGGAP
ncbi:MAG: hypothetical protein FWH12_09115 [Treponema sp.]|nr:hypothetical protein [Treponema sp.]